jgi:signal transduction histidine kinase
MSAKYNVKVQYAAWVTVLTFATVLALTGLHFARESGRQEAAALLRAQIAARTIAKNVEPLLATNNTAALGAVVANSVSDDDILYERVLDRNQQIVYKPWGDRAPSGMVIARQLIGPETNSLGTVEVGISKAVVDQGLMQTVLTDLGAGIAMVALCAAASFLASGPVRNALSELQSFVKRLSEGHSRGEKLESELREVEQVGAMLTSVVSRVEEAQAKLVKAQRELKAAQKEMDEYTYVISHDLKEPFSKFLVDDYRDKLDDEGRHRIDVIRNSALRMQRLINDLLKFSRLGQQKNPMELVGLNSMMMHVRLNLQYAIDAKKVDLRVDKLPMVVCDATAMTEVFHNLISNAIKYNDKPNPVVEIGGVEKLNPESKAPEYEFYVRDNGVGIKSEYFEKIFQIFQRLQRDEEGTGIGLTIVKRVIEWHGGRIWVESEPGRGTTFYFTLPKRDPNKMTSSNLNVKDTAPQGGAQLAATV